MIVEVCLLMIVCGQSQILADGFECQECWCLVKIGNLGSRGISPMDHHLLLNGHRHLCLDPLENQFCEKNPRCHQCKDK